MASTSSTSSSSSSISLLPSEPLPWRPNTRPQLPPCALLDIDQGPLWDIITEWLPFESVCHLDSALCNKSRRPEFLQLLATRVLLFNREEIRILTDPYDDTFTHKALGAAALSWVLKRGIHLVSLRLHRSNGMNAANQQRLREAVASLALNGQIDKLETISFVCCSYITDANLEAVLSKCYRSVKSIDIRRCGLLGSAAVHIKRCAKLEAFTARGNESAADMAEIFQACRKLRKLNLDALSRGLTDEAVLSMTENCHLLEHLSLSHCREVSDAAVRRVAESCPRLQFVNLSNTDITDATVVSMCNRCPILKRVFLGGCIDLTDETVLAIAERLPGLTHICLGGITAITSSAVEILASKCHELEYIDLNCCYIVSDATVMKLTEHCSKLRDLRVGGCRNLTDASISAVAEKLPGLTHIDLRSIVAITNSAVETLASKCHELEFINLSGCRNVSDDALMTIAEHCSKLEVLGVWGCLNVTEVGVEEIQSKCRKVKTIRYEFREYDEEDE